MITIGTRLQRGIQYFVVLTSLVLLCGCFPITALPNNSTETIVPTSTRLPRLWKVLGVCNADQSIMTAGLLDELHDATGSVIGQMGFSGFNPLFLLMNRKGWSDFLC